MLCMHVQQNILNCSHTYLVNVHFWQLKQNLAYNMLQFVMSHKQILPTVEVN